MSLGFLNPLGLLAALGVAVPIAVHLLQRRREAVLDFPAVRFLLLAQKRSSRRLRLRRLLLLALRCLAVLAFALVLARPVLHAPGAAFAPGAAGHTAVVLDTSLSMAARTGGGTRFEEARAFAAAVADQAGERERLALVEAALLPGAPGAARWLDRAGFRDALRAAAVRPAVADPARAFAEAYRLLAEAGPGAKRILVVTDLARGGWDRLSLAALPVLDPAVPVRVVRLVGGGAGNRAGVVRLVARGESRVAGETREVVAEILNSGPGAGLPAELWLDGSLAASRVEVVPPGTVGRVTFAVRPAEGSAGRCEVRLPGDGYPEDDRRFVALEVQPPVGVLLVDGTPAASLAQSETFFLQEALRPERLTATRSLQATTVGPDALDGPLPDARVVVLADVRAPGEAAARRLAEHVSGGGALVVFWGRNADPAAWQRSLGTLLPAPVTATEETAPDRPWRVGETDFEAPPLAVFRPPSGGTLQTAAFTLRAALGAPAPAARVLARFADGRPWIVEQPVGRGRVVFFASTAGLEGNDLATKPAFVPLAQRTVLWLAGSLDTAAEGEIVAGAEKVFTAGPELAGTAVRVETPGGAVRTALLRAAAGGSSAVFAETAEVGFYRWSRPGAAGLFAVNVPPEESDLTPLADAELERRLAPVRAEVVKLAPGAAAEVSRVGLRGLGRPLLALLLILLIAESLLAGPRPAPRRAGGGGASAA